MNQKILSLLGKTEIFLQNLNDFFGIVFGRKNDGKYRFLRQKPIGNYILDFYCSKLLLAIEIDGISHEDRIDYDHKRDDYLLSLGIKTIRYRDEDILKNMEGVVIDLENRIMIREKELGI